MYFLMQALDDDCRLILIGDPDQLPSVSAGAVFSSILPKLDALPGDNGEAGIGYVHLEKNERSVKAIGDAALCCKLGKAEEFLQLTPPKSLKEYFRLPPVPQSDATENPLARITGNASRRAEGIKQLITEWLDRSFGEAYFTLVREVLALDPVKRKDAALSLLKILEKSRILTFTHQTLSGRESCNRAASAWLQKGLKHDGFTPLAIQLHGQTFISGMPIIITANLKVHNRQLWNGDIGVLLGDDVWFCGSLQEGNAQTNSDYAPAQNMRAFRLADLPNADIAFAITVHKSQGSEYDRVLVIFPERDASPLRARQIVYTAITRAKKEVLLYGDDKIIKTAIQRSIDRESGLELQTLRSASGLDRKE
jgi:exodeoxyribonuclease V alpha subunit